MDTAKRLPGALPAQQWGLRREQCFHSLAQYLPALSAREIATIIVSAEKLLAEYDLDRARQTQIGAEMGREKERREGPDNLPTGYAAPTSFAIDAQRGIAISVSVLNASCPTVHHFSDDHGCPCWRIAWIDMESDKFRYEDYRLERTYAAEDKKRPCRGSD
jgi:hypothetical protein